VLSVGVTDNDDPHSLPQRYIRDIATCEGELRETRQARYCRLSFKKLPRWGSRGAIRGRQIR